MRHEVHPLILWHGQGGHVRGGPQPRPERKSAIIQGDTMQTGLDHIILGIDGLSRGVDWLEQRTGVRAIFGGAHPGRGTHNALMALGPRCYLEIMAPDPAQSAPTWFTQVLTLHAPRLIGWAVHTADLAALAQAATAAGLSIDGPHDGARSRPDGKVLSWKLFRLRDDRDGLLPLFLDWGDSIHPAQEAAPGCRLEHFLLQSPDAGKLQRIFQALSLEVPVEAAEKPRMLARITSPRGEVELTS